MAVMAAYSFGKTMLVIGLFAVMGLLTAFQNSIFRRGRRRKAERERQDQSDGR